MSGKDALLQLRQTVMAGRMPTWSADRQQIEIGSVSYPRSTLVPYHLYKKPDFYTLDALVIFLEDETAGKKLLEYLKNAQREGVAAVSKLQSKEVLSYLKGETDSNASIDVQGYEARLSGAGARGASEDVDMLGGEEMKEGDRSSAAGGSSSKRQRIGDSSSGAQFKQVSEWDVSDILREEQPLSTHLSVMQVGPKKNLGHLLEFYHKATGATKEAQAAAAAAAKAEAAGSSSRDKHSSSKSGKSSDKGRSSSSAAAGAPSSSSSSAPHNPVPIIVVPAALSSVINMWNCVQFLENGVYIPGDKVRDCKDPPPGPKKSRCTIARSSHYDPSRQVQYEVIDDVKMLRPSDWDRVVAVFVNGAAWQLADWPKDRWANPAAIFEQVAAFHLHFDDEPLHPNIAAWRTHRLPISKSKRHGDRGVVLDFWHLLTESIAAKNTSKRLNI